MSYVQDLLNSVNGLNHYLNIRPSYDITVKQKSTLNKNLKLPIPSVVICTQLTEYFSTKR